jgi:hypothetical protein
MPQNTLYQPFFCDKENKSLILLEKFRNFNILRTKIEFNNTVKNKFSGKRLIELGYSGKEIGQILKSFEKFVENNFGEILDNWIYKTDIDIINIHLNKVLDEYQMSKI